MKILLSSIVFGTLLIFLGKTGSKVKSLLGELAIITEEKALLANNLDEMIENNSQALLKIDDYKSAMEVGKISNIALSRNLAYKEKFVADLNMRFDGLLNLNKSLELDLEKLDEILLSESKKLNDLRARYLSLTQSNQLMIRGNTRLLSLNKLSNKKINQLQSYVSELEDENAIFIKSLNLIKGSSVRRNKSIPIGGYLDSFKVNEIEELESNFHAVGYHF
jgi:hypothetical protein